MYFHKDPTKFLKDNCQECIHVGDCIFGPCIPAMIGGDIVEEGYLEEGDVKPSEIYIPSECPEKEVRSAGFTDPFKFFKPSMRCYDDRGQTWNVCRNYYAGELPCLLIKKDTGDSEVYPAIILKGHATASVIVGNVERILYSEKLKGWKIEHRCESLQYDGSEECKNALLERNLYTKLYDDGEHLLEMFGLEVSKDHGIIHEGDTIVIRNHNLMIRRG